MTRRRQASRSQAECGSLAVQARRGASYWCMIYVRPLCTSADEVFRLQIPAGVSVSASLSALSNASGAD